MRTFNRTLIVSDISRTRTKPQYIDVVGSQCTTRYRYQETTTYWFTKQMNKLSRAAVIGKATTLYTGERATSQYLSAALILFRWYHFTLRRILQGWSYPNCHRNFNYLPVSPYSNCYCVSNFCLLCQISKYILYF